jgi:hypothetical protein
LKETVVVEGFSVLKRLMTGLMRFRFAKAYSWACMPSGGCTLFAVCVALLLFNQLLIFNLEVRFFKQKNTVKALCCLNGRNDRI